MLAAASIRAEPPLEFQFTGAPREVKAAQKGLAKWLKARSKREFTPKLETIAKKRLAAFAPETTLALRDAVADAPKSPRGKTSPHFFCPSLDLCPMAPATTHAERISDVPKSAALLIQPWLLLQHRRGGRLTLATTADTDSLLDLRLDGLLAGPIEIHAAPSSSGSLQLWLSASANLDDVYSFARESLLARPHDENNGQAEY